MFTLSRPAVLMVESVFIKASIGESPDGSSKRNSTQVITIYIRYEIVAVWLVLEDSFSNAVPGISAVAILCPSAPRTGKKDIARRRRPIPPSQLVMDFHSTTEVGNVSKGITHAPVVVHPEADSKKESAMEYPHPLRR